MFSTLKEMRSYVMSQLGAGFINERMITPSVVDSALNAAQAELAKYTMGLESVYVSTSVSGQEFYVLDPKFFKPRAVYYDGKKLKPQGKRPDTVNSATPTHYRVIGGMTSTPRLALYPIPNASSKEISVLADLFPDKMTGDTSAPEFNQGLTMAICIGALYFLTFGTSVNNQFNGEWRELKHELKQHVNSDIAEPMERELKDGVGIMGEGNEEMVVYRY